MEGIFSVMLMICAAEAVTCTKDNAKAYFTSTFVNAGEVKNPCEDWLLVQLEYNLTIKPTDWNDIGFYFQCKKVK